jgi:hypothetical protein
MKFDIFTPLLLACSRLIAHRNGFVIVSLAMCMYFMPLTSTESAMVKQQQQQKQ